MKLNTGNETKMIPSIKQQALHLQYLGLSLELPKISVNIDEVTIWHLLVKEFIQWPLQLEFGYEALLDSS